MLFPEPLDPVTKACPTDLRLSRPGAYREKIDTTVFASRPSGVKTENGFRGGSETLISYFPLLLEAVER